jgi:hypothetical protein
VEELGGEGLAGDPGEHAHGEEGSRQRADDVDPEVKVDVHDDSRTETARRVEGCSCPGRPLPHEGGDHQPDDERRPASGAGRRHHHEDDEDEHGRHDALDGGGCPRVEAVSRLGDTEVNAQGNRSPQATHDGCPSERAQALGHDVAD